MTYMPTYEKRKTHLAKKYKRQKKPTGKTDLTEWWALTSG